MSEFSFFFLSINTAHILSGISTYERIVQEILVLCSQALILF